jgi:hypothetical protein
MMEKQSHVVCYVKESGGFLDFNRRSEAHPVVASDGSLADIANRVSSYFQSKWRMASEIAYHENSPVYVNIEFPRAPSVMAKK